MISNAYPVVVPRRTFSVEARYKDRHIGPGKVLCRLRLTGSWDCGNIDADVEQSLTVAGKVVQEFSAEQALTAAMDDNHLPVSSQCVGPDNPHPSPDSGFGLEKAFAVL